MDVVRGAMSNRIPTINISTITGEIHVLAPPEWDDPFQRPLKAFRISASELLPEPLSQEIARAMSPSAALSHGVAGVAAASAYHRSRPAIARLREFFAEPIKLIPKPRLFKAVRNGLTAWPRPGERPPVSCLQVLNSRSRFRASSWRSGPQPKSSLQQGAVTRPKHRNGFSQGKKENGCSSTLRDPRQPAFRHDFTLAATPGPTRLQFVMPTAHVASISPLRRAGLWPF